ncbi:MAG: hypothetical protein L0Z53_07645, partial [Acidobacteriales bacterium]|nr:hypothetical protein [Terriglobales bacterium]
MNNSQNLWGFNANGNALGDEGFFLDTVKAWQSPALLMMNGIEGTNPANIVVRASRLQETWSGITIYRPFEERFEGRPWERPISDHLAFLRRFQAPWLWWNIANEPKPSGEAETRLMCKWFADLIRAAGDLRLVVYNAGVGTFERSHIEAGWYDDLLIALAENAHKSINVNGVLWPQFMLGSHSAAYWHGIPSVHCAGRNPADLIHPERLKEENWPTREQIFDADTSDNWIAFRDWWFVERTRKLRQGAPDIQIIATEAGFENIPKIREQFPDVVRKMDELCRRETRGMPTIAPYLEWAFPGQSAVETICKCCWFVQSRAPSVYRAFLHFTWSWHNAPPDFWRANYNTGE